MQKIKPRANVMNNFRVPCGTTLCRNKALSLDKRDHRTWKIQSESFNPPYHSNATLKFVSYMDS